MAANDAEKKVVEESPAEKDCGAAEDVGSELTAPPGWRKKENYPSISSCFHCECCSVQNFLMPKKGGTPRRNDIVFISPNGQEIKSKRQLDAFLRSHPGNPASSEFDWGTGQTPRRSARINEKMKATENPEGEKSRKRGRKASSKKTENEQKDVDSVTEASAAQEDAKVEAGEAKVEAEDATVEAGDAKVEAEDATVEAEDATVENTDAVDEKSKAAEDVEEKFKEEVISAETAIKEGAENIKEKTEELEEINKVDPADTEILPPATDSALKEMKDSKIPENGIPKSNDAAVPQDAPINPDDGPHQP